jgi:hypothetical protein
MTTAVEALVRLATVAGAPSIEISTLPQLAAEGPLELDGKGPGVDVPGATEEEVEPT